MSKTNKPGMKPKPEDEKRISFFFMANPDDINNAIKRKGKAQLKKLLEQNLIAYGTKSNV